MQLERLVIEAGDNSITLDFHPRLTVVSGVGALERDVLIGEIVGSLGAARSGVHLELSADNGSRFAVFRPHGAAHRVVDIGARADVTSQFVGEDGRIDLLTRSGLDDRSALRAIRLTASDLATLTDHDERIHQLARRNQTELWTAAEAVAGSQERLDTEAQAVGSRAEDAEVVSRIEQRHAEFEEAQARSETSRRNTFLIAGISALAAIPLVRTMGPIGVVAPAVLAVLAVIASIVFWRRNEQARVREEEALAEAGAQSYLGFHLQRVNILLASDQCRRRLLQASEDHRVAAHRWSVIAGDVDVAWALEHRNEVTEAARLLQGLHTPAPAERVEASDRTPMYAHAITSRLTTVRSLGPGGERFPALLDEPFTRLEHADKGSLLELLVRASAHQQIVLFTDDPAVESWARLEAMTGAVAVLAPTPANATADA